MPRGGPIASFLAHTWAQAGGVRVRANPRSHDAISCRGPVYLVAPGWLERTFRKEGSGALTQAETTANAVSHLWPPVKETPAALWGLYHLGYSFRGSSRR